MLGEDEFSRQQFKLHLGALMQIFWIFKTSFFIGHLRTDASEPYPLVHNVVEMPILVEWHHKTKFRKVELEMSMNESHSKRHIWKICVNNDLSRNVVKNICDVLRVYILFV